MSKVHSTINYYGKEFTFWPAGGWVIERNAFAIMVIDPDGEPVLCLGIRAAEELAQALLNESAEFHLETEQEVIGHA